MTSTVGTNQLFSDYDKTFFCDYEQDFVTLSWKKQDGNIFSLLWFSSKYSMWNWGWAFWTVSKRSKKMYKIIFYLKFNIISNREHKINKIEAK